MNPTFNLLDVPWIPSVDRKNRAVVLNLRETLLQAHRLRELAGESPLITASLYRLLLAILHRVFGPRDEETWFDLWNAGQFPAGPLENYLRQWHHRFNLFDVERPFYQAADERVQPKSINSLILDLAFGNKATLFDHHTDKAGVALTPAESACAVVTAQTFGLAGLSGLPQKFTDGTCARGVLFMIQGNTLFKTLMLNLIRYPTEDDVLPHYADDLPAWEMDDPYTPDRTSPRGYLDYLTWQNRRILLLPEATGKGIVVQQMTLAPGLRLASDILSPIKHYRADEKKGPIVLRFNESRALWRDSVALFKLRDRGFRPPRTFAWLSHLIEYDFEYGKGKLKPGLRRRYMALGMANNQAKVYFYRAEYNPLPLEYLTNPTLVGRLDEALKMTEDVRNKLWGAARTLATYIISPQADAEGAHKPDPKDLENLTARWAIDRDYWGQLEIPFRRLVEKLPDDVEGTLERWQQTLRRTAWTAFDRVANDLEHDPRNLKATVYARGQLAAGLGKVLPQQNRD